ncbi:MAG: Lrp/AsnC ligand binding domain-containing protein [Deltaproteobacteria bacterium]|nr:Lrp/AsnC ligand binding domain-containing protein [Deltaproteobacteria bacterium]
MAVSAYVFIECEHGKSMAVADKAGRVAGVRDAHAVTGPYDVIAYVTASNFKVLGDVVIKKIQGIAGVRKTLTNVVVE